MDKLNDKSKLIISAIVVVVAVVLIVYYGAGTPASGPNLGTTTPTSGSSPSAPSGGSTNPATGGTGTQTGGTTGGTKTSGGITFVTPIAGQTWIIAQQNTIEWSRAGGVSGQIDLLDASTKALVGVIIPQTGMNQSSYAWNTRDIFLSRTSPLKKNVVPGTYVIRVAWDGNRLSSITSQPIVISQ